MDKEEILDRFLKAVTKNNVLTCVHVSTRGMDASRMEAMVTAINAKPSIVSPL